MSASSRQIKLLNEALESRYGESWDPRSAWAHMGEAQREDARLAAAARILLAQDLDKYAPAIALVEGLTR